MWIRRKFGVGVTKTNMLTKTKMKTLVASAAVALAFGSAGMAQAASLTATFDIDGSTGGLGAGPYGTVTITEDTLHTGWLDFTVTPGTNMQFHKTQNSNHEAFYFDLNGDPAITIMALTAGFAVGPTGKNSPPFNQPWDYSISVAANTAGPLTFKVKKTNNVALTIADLGSQVYNSTHKVRAASDMIYTDPKTGKTETGNVGAEDSNGAVPEPATWTMMILGFGVIGMLFRSRRRALA